MIKLILWVLILLGLALPFGLATIAFLSNQQTRMPWRYTQTAVESSEDPVVYQHHVWLAFGNYRITINTRAYPSFIMFAGISVLLFGTILLLHVGTSSDDTYQQVLMENASLDSD